MGDDFENVCVTKDHQVYVAGVGYKKVIGLYGNVKGLF